MFKKAMKMVIVMILVITAGLGVMAKIGHDVRVKEAMEKDIIVALLDYYEVPGWPETFEKNGHCWTMTYDDHETVIPDYLLYTDQAKEIYLYELAYTARY